MNFIRSLPLAVKAFAVLMLVVTVVILVMAAFQGAPATPSAAATFTPVATVSPTARATPSATPTPMATTVTFTVSGYAPGTPTIQYGSDSITHQEPPAAIDGTQTYNMTYVPGSNFYMVSAQLDGSGHVTVKIIVNGMTVSSGSTYGQYGTATAQAAPLNPSGTAWSNQQ